MAYSINPNLPKARALAMQLLVRDALPAAVVANKCGVHRSTIWRWKQKWDEINKNVQFDNPNRPGRAVSLKNKLLACKWRIATVSSRPHSCSHAVGEEIVRRIMEMRRTLQRCAEVVWHHLTTEDGIQISLSSVRRILRRNHAFDGARKNRVRPDNPRRPHPTRPGELVQTDTIHYICPTTYQRRYAYTVIDLYSRLTYTEIHDHVRPGIAADVILRAQAYGGFAFHMVQADNGPEYSSYFEQRLRGQNIQVRHSRLGRPNDNAHIERFNRTIQEECFPRGEYQQKDVAKLQKQADEFTQHYINRRWHMGLPNMMTPAQFKQYYKEDPETATLELAKVTAKSHLG